jgi:hypothetical protein
MLYPLLPAIRKTKNNGDVATNTHDWQHNFELDELIGGTTKWSVPFTPTALCNIPGIQQPPDQFHFPLRKMK